MPALAVATIVLGTMLTTFGISFDIQWHDDVGPDTFFTLSHLMLYAGSALEGLASLAMVLLTTARQRRGDAAPAFAGGPPVRVLGARFTAPLGYLVAGVGAALFLMFGALDLAWHSVYGFDAVLNSPPHIALFLSITLTMVGSIIVCAAASTRWWGRVGIVLGAIVLMAFAPLTARAFDGLPLPFDTRVAGTCFATVTTLIVLGAVLKRSGSMLALAAAFGMLQAILWPWSTWAAHAYADSSGLPLRDGLTGEPPSLPSSLPLFVVVAALCLELAFAVARQRRLGQTTAFMLGGSAAGIVVSVTLLLQTVLFDPTESILTDQYISAGITGLVLGAVSGFLGARLAVLLTMPQAATAGRRVSSSRTVLSTGVTS
jgi:hypothetical protein